MSAITNALNKIMEEIIKIVEDIWEALFGWTKHRW